MFIQTLDLKLSILVRFAKVMSVGMANLCNAIAVLSGFTSNVPSSPSPSLGLFLRPTLGNVPSALLLVKLLHVLVLLLQGPPLLCIPPLFLRFSLVLLLGPQLCILLQ